MITSRGRGEKDAEFERLLEQVKASRGFDFTCYKRATLMRRIRRRMSQVNVGTFADYRDYLEVEPQEFTEMFNTMLINVTSFFRDEAAWEALKTEALPRLAASPPGSEIRVWSAGCASGEEAYSLAMMLIEAIGEDAFRRRVKIYATDVDEEALAKARHASFPAKDIEPVPPALRKKCFEETPQGWTFRADLRRSVIFGRHDLLQDAPISRLDLLLCRNTLMYFNADAQSRIVARLHFGLNPTGLIFLGKAEMLQNHSALFQPVSLKHRIFAKVPGSQARELAPLAGVEPRVEAPERPATEDAVRDGTFDACPTAQVAVDGDRVLAAANRAARSLFGLSPRDIGRPFKDLEMSYRPLELRALVDQVLRTRQTASQPVVGWPTPGNEERVFHVQAGPILRDGQALGVSITFTDITAQKKIEEEYLRSRQELETASEELQSANEELETTNEELQSTIEELETTNEELQSGNEEMETMNEELQSTNQEMQTVNDELQQRSEQISDANAFLESILSGIGLGAAVVDANLNVETWNRSCENLWGMRREEAVGKNLLSLDIGLPVDKLKAPAKAILSRRAERRQIEAGAVDRRGRRIRCRVTCTPRFGPKKEVRGVILLMEPLDEPSEKE